MKIQHNDPEILSYSVKYLNKTPQGEVPVGGQFQIKYKYSISIPTDGSKPEDAGRIEPVGATDSEDALDFRSNKGVPGPGSLEVMVNNKSFQGYADVDRFNVYGGLAPATAHIFGEVLPNRIRRFFGRK